MIEEIRQKFKKKKQSGILQLPIILNQKKTGYNLICSENTFNLCRVGALKNKFTNFKLKNPKQQKQLPTCASDSILKIPMLSYNENKFGYLKQQKHKIQHSLLVSRVSKQNGLPSIGDYDTSNYQKMRYPQPKNFFITSRFSGNQIDKSSR